MPSIIVYYRVFLPVYKLCVLLFEFRLEVTVGQIVAFQLCHLLLQITDLRETNRLLAQSTTHVGGLRWN